MHPFRRLSNRVIVILSAGILLAIGLVACGMVRKAEWDAFDKIQIGMSGPEVKGVLGLPTLEDDFRNNELNRNEKVCHWYRNGKTFVILVFFDESGRAVSKRRMLTGPVKEPGYVSKLVDRIQHLVWD